VRRQAALEQVSGPAADRSARETHRVPRPVNVRTPARKIKIMLAIDGLHLGGAEMVVRDLARALDRDSFDVCICCTRGVGGPLSDELQRDGFDVFGLPDQSNERPDYLTALKFRRAIIEKGVDIVHTHALAPLLDVSPWRLTMPGLRIVHTFHYGNYPRDEWLYHLLEGLCTRAAHRLIAVGREQRRQIEATFRLRESRIGVIWNGIAMATPEADGSFRRQMRTGDRLLVGTIAKLIEQKGLDTLLDVARHCRDAGHPMQFVIVGGGPLQSELEQRRRELDLEDTVVFTGWVPNAATRALPEFDVFFQPSRWEAMSIAILEAMANGKAIVATRVGDNAHMVEDGISGLLVDTGDVQSMVDALARSLDPRLRLALGEAARTRFEQTFTLEHMIRGYESVYRELVRR
jgi:glycosyltransferase involved in cell wall biosynthesis